MINAVEQSTGDIFNMTSENINYANLKTCQPYLFILNLNESKFGLMLRIDTIQELIE
ncbi:hypothetical protein [Clostridium sp. D46t1_190503_E9]|uniref:hypothetical protein n=1 Tax=Clostridium sp. D46t1_190503_E9 TaxID=2787137 RepID=UPI001A9C0522|nr:hypothetical protein [Clostridium sp. D46t1_190503_E9]